MGITELKPVKESPRLYDELENEILRIFRQEIYAPLIEELDREVILNSDKSKLLEAISTGRVQFYRGQFTGRFNAAISRELYSYGAVWDRKQGSFRILLSDLPHQIKAEISMSESRIKGVFDRIARKLEEKLNSSNSEYQYHIHDIFDTTLWKINKDVDQTLKNITVMPELTSEDRSKIAKEYTENMDLYIQGWTKREIISLRKEVQELTVSGLRRESLQKLLEQSYGSSKAKAKFLAKQETSLMLAQFKESRYRSAGIDEYKWCCVVGSPLHPVRPMHKKLAGTIQRWDDPPVTDEEGNRNNPGQDYNCRCFAKPIVRS